MPNISNLVDESFKELLKTKKREEITAEDIGKLACNKFDEAFRIACKAQFKKDLTLEEEKAIILTEDVFFTKRIPLQLEEELKK